MSPLPAEDLTLLVVAALVAIVVLCAAVAVPGSAAAVGAPDLRPAAGRGDGEDLLAAVARQVEATDRLRSKPLRSWPRRPAPPARLQPGRHRRPDPLRRLPRRRRLAVLLGGVPGRGRGRGGPHRAINGRAETRSYAKPVRGRSGHNLSDEERAAITLAMGATSPNSVSPVR